jgi:hypothetical protein
MSNVEITRRYDSRDRGGVLNLFSSAKTGTLALLLLLAAPAYGQVLQTQQGSNGNQGATKSVALSLSKPATKGSLLGVQVVSTCTAAPTLKDSIGNTFTLDKVVAGQQGAAAFHATNTTSAADTITASFATACSYAAIFAEEVNGLSGAVDSSVSNTSAALGGTIFNVGALTATGADFLVAVGDNNYGVKGFTAAATGFTLIQATMSPGAAAYQMASKAGSYNVSFTMPQPGYKVTGLAIAYTPSGVTPPNPPQTCTGTATVTVTGSTTPPLQITTPITLPGATVGTAYSQNLSAAFAVSGGVPPYSFVLASGSTLPTWATLSTTGVLSGTPTAAGTFTFSVTITDSSGTALKLRMKARVKAR